MECLPGPDVSQIAGHFGGCLALVQDLNGQPSFQYDNIYIHIFIYVFIYLCIYLAPKKIEKIQIITILVGFYFSIFLRLLWLLWVNETHGFDAGN